MSSADALERHLARFKRLPRRDTVWEGAIVALPGWVEGTEDAPPFRPIAALWVSETPRLAHQTSEDEAGTMDAGVAITTLCEMGASGKLAGHRPAIVRVQEEGLATALTVALTGCDTAVELVSALPALNAYLELMAEVDDDDDTPAALDVAGVTVEHLRGFGDAAQQFCKAAPWRHLNDGDLIRVEAPAVAAGLALLSVMGSAGEQFGLAFFSSEGTYRAVMDGGPPEELFTDGGEYGVYMAPGWEVPIKDVLLWEQHHLPMVLEGLYPFAVRAHPDEGRDRPDARALAHFEGLLRVLADTSESEMDSGRWSRQVQTSEGPATYVLTLSDLLDPERIASDAPPSSRAMERMAAEVGRVFRDQQFDSLEALDAAIAERFGNLTVDEIPSTATTPLERAQDLIYDAFDERGRRQLQLIQKALALTPDCIDAYVLLAERAVSVNEARAFYEQGVAAGERALGPGILEDPEHVFWGNVTSRPYLRARLGLADCLRQQGDFAGAAEHLRAALELDPDDHQGVRYSLMGVLLEAELDDEAEELLREHDDDGATWAYASVLLALRRTDRRVARSRLRDALRANRHVPRYLTGQRELPNELPESYVPGDADEAVLCAVDLIGPWAATPGAAAWLRSEMRGRR